MSAEGAYAGRRGRPIRGFSISRSAALVRRAPYVALPCTDSIAQAFSRLMSVNLGNDGSPHRVGAIIVDTLTGRYAAQALGVALYARERRGEGRYLEVSLTQCAAAILGHKLIEHGLED